MSAADASAAPGSGGSEEERLRAAYEAELARVTSAELLLQSAAALLNHAARRLGLAGGGGASDHGQARDAIDGVRALMPVLERTCPKQQVQALRDALAQLQLAFAGAVSGSSGAGAASTAAGAGAADQPRPPAGSQGAGGRSGQERPDAQSERGAGEREPGPAQRSGRLWVPGGS